MKWPSTVLVQSNTYLQRGNMETCIRPWCFKQRHWFLCRYAPMHFSEKQNVRWIVIASFAYCSHAKFGNIAACRLIYPAFLNHWSVQQPDSLVFFLSSFILADTNLHVIQKKNCSHADSRKPQCDLKQCRKKTIIPNPPSLSYKFAFKSLQWLKANRVFVIRTAQSHPPQHTQKHRNVITCPINKASFPQINKNTRPHSPSNNAIFTKCKVCGLFSRNTHLGHNSLHGQRH